MGADGIFVRPPSLGVRTVNQPYSKVGGLWRSCTGVYRKHSGSWQKVWPTLQIIYVASLFGGSYNGGEQFSEYNSIVSVLSANGVFSSGNFCYVHRRDSNAYWILTPGNYFYVNSTFIGTTMQLDHWQDGLGVDNTIHSPCGGGSSSYEWTQGRWASTLYVYKYI